jgi:hypothetical protein
MAGPDGDGTEQEEPCPVLLKYYVQRVISKVVVPGITRINRAKERKEHKAQ